MEPSTQQTEADICPKPNINKTRVLPNLSIEPICGKTYFQIRIMPHKLGSTGECRFIAFDENSTLP